MNFSMGLNWSWAISMDSGFGSCARTWKKPRSAAEPLGTSAQSDENADNAMVLPCCFQLIRPKVSVRGEA